jgi:hypothetical protein
LPKWIRLAVYRWRLHGAKLDVEHYARGVAHYQEMHARARARHRRLQRAINEVRFPLRLPSRLNWRFLRKG